MRLAAHCLLPCFVRPARPIAHRSYLERARMARAGIRALDTKGHRSRAAFAGELNFREEHPKAEVRRVEDLRLARGGMALCSENDCVFDTPKQRAPHR